MQYYCCDRHRDNRLNVIRQFVEFNGIDYLEVTDDPPIPNKQPTLVLHLINPLAIMLEAQNFRISGGARIQNIEVMHVRLGDREDILELLVSEPGDFSMYTLSVVDAANNNNPPVGFDRLLSNIDFSFKYNCADDFDCNRPEQPAPETRQEPVINYLAKDYASFRKVILDRLALLLPNWQETHPADLVITLIELLAYVGDYLSYSQDMIAMEAYPGTARQRISMRRHARLVDYRMHDGCNARIWVHIEVSSDFELHAGTQLFTKIASRENQVVLPSEECGSDIELFQGAEVFESIQKEALYIAHNTLNFYTWGEQECCLPAGTTRATLKGHIPELKKGTVLIFKEQLGPATGDPADTDPSHCWAVRLTEATEGSDPVGGLFDGSPKHPSIRITEIAWDEADALPFSLCLSSVTADNVHVSNVSVALGNIVLADHGRTVKQVLTFSTLQQSRDFRPKLEHGPLTQVGQVVCSSCTDKSSSLTGQRQQEVAVFDPSGPASAAMYWDYTLVHPAIRVLDGSDKEWEVQQDLLNSDGFSKVFVAEVDDYGLAHLRFGNDIYGMKPNYDYASKEGDGGSIWQAIYRIGNGKAGNVGANTIEHIRSSDRQDVSAVIKITNPLPGVGGRDPESMEQVLQNAPVAFNTLERSVTLSDYSEIAQRFPGVQRAVATYQWTGSWRTVCLSVDRFGGTEVDTDFMRRMELFLERYRMEGQDLRISGPRYVPLELVLQVCIKPGYVWNDVKAALSEAFSNRRLSYDRRGLFHPDNFTFGQDVYLSRLYAAAQAVKGVAFTQITTLRRLGQSATEASGKDMLSIGPLEVARLDNDRNFPERGILRIEEQ